MSRVEMRRFGSRDWFALGLLIGLATVLFTLPAAIGQPLLPGDALNQNYPLRVLSGNLLAHGHLPLWNGWIWSGTPLLGGLNAGALYPGTFLFAIAPPLVAWVTNEVAAYALCAVGLYLLLRTQRLVPIAAGLAAVSFTFAGFMGAHLRHTGLIQGTALVPWMLLAIEGLDSSRRRLSWWLLLCASGGLIVLTGEPRAISNAAIVTGIYVVALLVRRDAARARLLVWAVAAVPVVFALGAVQLLPGLDFVHTSQRATTDYAFFAHGSLTPEMLPLMVVPYLLGAYGTLDFLPSYIGRFNLHEIVGYIGLLPLVALVTLPFWRPRRAVRLWAWVAMIAVGLLLALGSNTPLGSVLAHVPLYSGQRLQSRNLMVVDFGLAGVFAWWLNSVVTRPRSTRSARDRRELFVGLLPPALVVALVLTAWSAGPTLQRWLDAGTSSSTLFDDLTPYLAGVLVLAVAVGAFLFVRQRLTPRARAAFLVAVVAVDVGLVFVNGELGFTDASALRRDVPHTAALRAALGGGRLAVYDPGHRVVGDLDVALASDLPIVHEVRTAQGYGSVVDGRYESATGAHRLRVFSLSVLSGVGADQLDLRLVLVPSSYVDAATNGGGNLQLDPQLEAALTPPHWVSAGRSGPYLVYANTRARGRAWIEPLNGASRPAASVTGAEVRRTDVGAGDSETDVIRTPERALLVRSVAYAEGWSARLTTTSGESKTVPARRFGLVQAVEVPAGADTVVWSYDPPGFRVGLWLTLLATVVVTALAVWLVVRGIVARRSTRARSGRGE